MMSEAPENARYAIIAHVVHLVNRDYEVGDPLMFTMQAGHTPSQAAFFLGLENCCRRV